MFVSTVGFFLNRTLDLFSEQTNKAKMIIYEEFSPDKSLSHFIHCFWYFEDPAPSNHETVVPDGRPELIIHLGEPYAEGAHGKLQPRLLFAGQLTEPLVLTPTGRVAFWGVRFRPDGARHFLGSDVSSATNKRIDLSELISDRWSALQKALLRDRQIGVQLETVSNFLSEEIGEAKPDPVVRLAMDQILVDFSTPLEHELTDRQFQRRFKREVGVSMKTFKTIRRFRSVFDRIKAQEDDTWVQRALDSGYFDQPQMVRDFKRLLGISPQAWIEREYGLGQALASSDG